MKIEIINKSKTENIESDILGKELIVIKGNSKRIIRVGNTLLELENNDDATVKEGLSDIARILSYESIKINSSSRPSDESIIMSLLAGVDSLEDILDKSKMDYSKIKEGSYILTRDIWSKEDRILSVVRSNEVQTEYTVCKRTENYTLATENPDNSFGYSNTLLCITNGFSQLVGDVLKARCEFNDEVLTIEAIKCEHLLLKDCGHIVFNKSCVIEGEDGNPAISCDKKHLIIENTQNEEITLVLKSGSMSACIGGYTGTGLSYGRWSPWEKGPETVTFRGKINVVFEPQVENLILGTYGESYQPKVFLINGARCNVENINDPQICLFNGETYGGSTKRTGGCVYYRGKISEDNLWSYAMQRFEEDKVTSDKSDDSKEYYTAKVLGSINDYNSGLTTSEF